MSRSIHLLAAPLRPSRVLLAGVLVFAFALVSPARAEGAAAADKCNTKPAAMTAATLLGSKFQGIDGDQCNATGLPLTFDWQKLVADDGFMANGGGTTTVDDPTSTVAQFSGSGPQQEDDPDNWNLVTGDPSSEKTNILAAWGYPDNQTDLFLYLAYHRTANKQGTAAANFDFELNKLSSADPNDPANAGNWWVNKNGVKLLKRSAGDRLIVFDQTGGDPAAINICTWVPDAGTATPWKDGTWSCPTDPASTTGLAQGFVNDGFAITNFLPGTDPALPFVAEMANRTFGETAINLSDALGLGAAQPCASFGSLGMRSRQSPSVSATLADNVTPVPIQVGNCGKVVIKKETTPDEDPNSTSFTFDGDGFNTAVAESLPAGTNPNNPFTLKDDGKLEIIKVQPNDGPLASPYSVEETIAGAGYALEGIACDDTDSGVRTDNPSTIGDEADAETADIRVSAGETVTCTFTNARETGKLEVKKALSPASDTGRFNLQIDGTTERINAAHGDSTGEETLFTGTHTVGEVAGSTGAMADYRKSIACRDENGTGTVVASNAADNPGPLNVPVTAKSDIVCVVTNVRETGKLEVSKALSPTNDQGRFNLQIDGTTEKADAANAGTTGEKTLNTGTHTVGEVAGSTGALSDYQKSIECKDGNGAGTVVATTAADDDGPLNVDVGHDDDIVCVVTNVRETGKLEVVKDIEGNASGDTFDLRVDGDVKKANAADGGTTGKLTYDTGTYTVSEAPGTAPGGTDLDDYQKKIVCMDGATEVAKTAAGQDVATLDVKVEHDADVVCTITNVRERGKLEVVKDVVGDAGDDTFNLRIAGDVRKENAGDGDSTGELTYDTGAYTVSETAGTAPTGTNLDWYTKKIVCVDGATTVAQTTPGQDLASLQVAVEHDADVVCTITNDLEEGTLRVEKQTDPDETNGEAFAFTTTAGSGFSLADDQVESRSVRPGSYTVTEGTKSGYRLQGVACDDGNSTSATGTRTATYDIGPGENVKCTFTNTKLNASAVVVKAGNEFAYHGDQVTYTFVVTNPGNSPLTDVTVADDRCAPVAGPDRQVNGGGADALDPGDRWVYSCTTTIGAHADGEQNPRINTVTVAAKDEQGRPVEAKDDHATRLLHPAIAIDKSGPASGLAGQPVSFTMDVTNPGDVAFTEGFVAVADPRCEAPPALAGKNGDASPVTLDPGDRWTYACRVQTADGQTEVTNTATVTGTDSNGRRVSAEDTVTTPLAQPVRQVAASRRASPGAARLQGPSGCTIRPFMVRIRGREIERVAFFVGKKRVRTLTAQASQDGREQVLTFRIDPRKLSRGKVHRVSARVTFTATSGTQARTLRLAFQRCRAAVKPKFTG